MPISLDPTAMPDGLRNQLWNSAKKYIDKLEQRNSIIELLWDIFFKQDLDTLKCNYSMINGKYAHLDQIKEKFWALKWYEAYDFIEFLIKPSFANEFIEDLNYIFIEEKAPYKIINQMITPLISGIEAEEIEEALKTKYSEPSNHLKRALDLYHKRPDADYKNSIKESISAIEALACIILEKPNATLGELTNQLPIHSAFKAGIHGLYGWTCDQGGIRHKEKKYSEGVLKIDEKEARYMLVQCSALVNYIISKHESETKRQP